MRSSELLPQLRFVEAAIRLSSFDRAAVELHVSPSAVSQQVAKAEKRLGVRLFERTRRGVEPTATARDLARELALAFETIERAVDAVRKEDTTGPVGLLIYQTWATRWLIPRLESLYARVPGIEVRFETGMRPADFLHSDLDFAVQFAPGESRGGRATELFSQVLVPVCAPTLARRIRSAEDLRGLPLIVSQNRTDDWDVWFDAVLPEAVGRTPQLRFSNSTLAYEAALAGSGVAMGQSTLVAPDVATGALVAPVPIGVDSGRTICLLEPSDRPLRPAAKAFRSWILAEAKASLVRPSWMSDVLCSPTGAHGSLTTT